MLFGHVDIHRFLKDLVKSECVAIKASKSGGTPLTLNFSAQMAKILLKNFDDAIRTRACFILLALTENEET